MNELGRAHGSKVGPNSLQTVEEHWRHIFSRYDQDGDGKIPVRELSQVLQGSHFNQDVPQKVVDKIVQHSDTNKDSFITFPEFIEMIETPEGQHLTRRWLNMYIYHTIVPRKRRKTLSAVEEPDGQYEDEYSCYPPPVSMLIMSILEISTFIWEYVTVEPDSTFGEVGCELIYDPHRRKEAWRFLSYMFVHIGIYHLFVNLFVQIMLGIPLEMVHRWWRVLIIYISGVAAGSLATSVLDPDAIIAGASGGVYAVITAHLATLILNWSEMRYAVWQLLFFFFLFFSDVGPAIYTRYFLQKKTKIAYVAHFGGAVAGLLVGLYVLRNLEVRSWEKKIWWSALIIYLGLMVGMILWNICYPSYFPSQSIKLCN